MEEVPIYGVWNGRVIRLDLIDKPHNWIMSAPAKPEDFTYGGEDDVRPDHTVGE
jgi:hypothetical protein